MDISAKTCMFSLLGPQADAVMQKLQAGAIVGAAHASHSLLSFASGWHLAFTKKRARRLASHSDLPCCRTAALLHCGCRPYMCCAACLLAGKPVIVVVGGGLELGSGYTFIADESIGVDVWRALTSQVGFLVLSFGAVLKLSGLLIVNVQRCASSGSAGVSLILPSYPYVCCYVCRRAWSRWAATPGRWRACWRAGPSRGRS